jgi:hypothetical protein
MPDAEGWEAVEVLTRELNHTKFAPANIHAWDFAIRLFRQVERERFFENEPTENDRAHHRALLHLLIGLGEEFELRIKQISDGGPPGFDQELAGFGISRPNLTAYIRDLEDTFFLWYVPDFDPARTAELGRTIFGADT